jgi:hypothetical protein
MMVLLNNVALILNNATEIDLNEGLGDESKMT